MSGTAFTDPAVAAIFASYPEPVRSRLFKLRELIFETAAATAGVGPLQETLKWRQPAYLTPQTGSGSTIRIDRVAGSDSVALYCHCQTDLISVFRELYPQRFRYQGNRALVLDKDRADAAQPLSHCIALALTYHLRRKAAHARSAARGSSVNKSA